MKVLIIGRRGQLATALGEALPDATRLGRDEVDLRDPQATERAVRDCCPDVVINAGAYTDVEGAEDEREIAYAINRDGVAGLARGSAEIGAALVHVSTDYVFDGTKTGEWVESDPPNPINVYGASKLAGEQAAIAANPRTVVLRTSWLYSPWGRNFATTMLRLADREELTIVDDQSGKPTSALNLARAIRDLLPRIVEAPADASVWGVYHYAGRGATSWARFASWVFAEASRELVSRVPKVVPITSAEYPTRAKRPLNSALDCTAFETTFGIQTVGWRDALAEVVDRIQTERKT